MEKNRLPVNIIKYR